MLEKPNPVLMDEKIVLANRVHHFSEKILLCSAFQQHYRSAEANILGADVPAVLAKQCKSARLSTNYCARTAAKGLMGKWVIHEKFAFLHFISAKM